MYSCTHRYTMYFAHKKKMFVMSLCFEGCVFLLYKVFFCIYNYVFTRLIDNIIIIFIFSCRSIKTGLININTLAISMFS